MGWDMEDAEAEYWASEYVASNEPKSFNRAWQRAKALGYTDEEILAMGEWPTVAKSVRARLGLNREMKERTSPIGEPDWPESLLARAAREAKEALDAETRARKIRAETRARKINETKENMRMINKTRVIADLRQAIADAQKELALLERIPAEPVEKMTSFTVTFPGSTKPYVYVGLRVDGDWLMSGKHFEGSNWTWSGIFKRFEEIHATVSYISTPTEYRHEQVYR